MNDTDVFDIIAIPLWAGTQLKSDLQITEKECAGFSFTRLGTMFYVSPVYESCQSCGSILWCHF